ncbi:MAG: hypothetical protein FWD92_01155 [Methanomassiliicoccaceae archaeon]|nr:hypothetical protein [Methanomassiliicoccaceae archaeon]
MNIRGTPTLDIRTCPDCGNEIELFSDDVKAICENCGFIVYNDVQSCISWCPHAKECIGEAAYKRLTERNDQI